jgi:predicted phage terminase large subunit-like protein
MIGRGWDLAATKQTGTRDPDWTVGLKMARLPSGLYVVLDVVRFRGGPDEVDGTIRNITRQDGAGIRVSLPQDPGQAGKSQALAFTRLLSGYRVEISPETGDKATRASLFASQVNGGNVAIVRAPWNAAFLDELAAFPSGIKDDQVDAASRCFSLVGLSARPMVISDTLLERMAAGGRY